MIAIGVFVAAAITLAICPPLIRELGRRAVIDVPGARSSHTVATPRGGGLGPAIGACAGLLVAIGTSSSELLTVAGIAVAFGALGLIDDLSPIAVRWRLVAQFAVATAGAVLLTTASEGSELVLLALPLGVAWQVAYVNAFNFMDGINGISAVQTVVAGVAWGSVGLWQDQTDVAAGGFVIASATLAFAPFNFPRARVFLGDVGSYFLGAWLAALALVGLDTDFTVEMAAAPLVLYLCDTGTTLARRRARGAPLIEAHREHTYQRLVASGWSHTRTTLFVGLLVALSALLGTATMFGSIAVRLLADIGLVAIMVGYLVSPRMQARRTVGAPARSTVEVRR